MSKKEMLNIMIEQNLDIAIFDGKFYTMIDLMDIVYGSFKR